MAAADVRQMREGYAAFVRGGVEATLEYYTDDCVFEGFPEMPDRS